MDLYTHLEPHDKRAALEKLPDMPVNDKKNAGAEQIPAAKTGSDNLPVQTDPGAYKKLLPFQGIRRHRKTL
jgi:hypothetical protein